MRAVTALGIAAALVAGAAVGVTTQHLASAGVSSGERPVLISIEPCRLADTRPPPNEVGPIGTKIGAAETLVIDTQQAGTACSGAIPGDALALSLNVTALGATSTSFLTIWGDGERPTAASLNPAPSQPPVPNAVVTELSPDQEFRVYNDAGQVNIVVDVNGYYVDHDHDDAYSPLGHDHAGLYEPTDDVHEITIDIGAAHRQSGGFSPGSGVSLAVGASVYPTFVVPHDLTPGATMTIDLVWRIFETGCDLGFASGGSTNGWRPEAGPTSLTMTFPTPVAVPANLGTPHRTTGTITGAASGDAVILDIEPAGTCGGADITGVTITYP